MKKLLLICIVLVSFFGCKKEESTTHIATITSDGISYKCYRDNELVPNGTQFSCETGDYLRVEANAHPSLPDPVKIKIVVDGITVVEKSCGVFISDTYRVK